MLRFFFHVISHKQEMNIESQASFTVLAIDALFLTLKLVFIERITNEQ